MSIFKNKLQFCFYGAFILLSMCSAFFCIKKKENLSFNLNQKSQSVSLKIKRELEDLFAESEKILRLFSENILRLDCSKNPKVIENVLVSTGELRLKTLSKSYISFADSEGNLIVSGKEGIISDKKKHIRERDYFRSCRLEPWTLKTSKITQSLFSEKAILPTAFGIENKGKFEGYLVLGMNIDEIKEHLFQKYKEQGLKFYVIDSDNKITPILDMEGPDFSPGKSLFFKKKIEIEGSPYFLIAGFERDFYIKSLIEEVYPLFFVCAFFAFLFLAAIFILKNYFLNPVNKLREVISITSKDFSQNSDSAISLLERAQQLFLDLEENRRKFLKKEGCMKISFEATQEHYHTLNQRYRDFFESILNDLKIEISKNQNISPLVHDAYQKTKAFISGFDDFEKETLFSLSEIIDECKAIYEPFIFERGIHFFVKGVELLDPIRGKRFLIKKVLLTLIENSFKKILSGGYLCIEAKWISGKKGGKFLEIKLEDNGLNEKFLKGVKKRLGLPLNTKNPLCYPSLKMLTQVVELEGGRTKYEFDVKKGRVYRVYFPSKIQKTEKSYGNLRVIQGGILSA